MHWMRRPRLNSAVATVAVETVLSLSRVVVLSLVMSCSLHSPPPCGEGSGVGVHINGVAWGYPPPQPSPTRGEGAHLCRGDIESPESRRSGFRLRLPRNDNC